MESRPLQERLDEVTIRSQADIKVIAESIYFYWNLARHKGEPIVVEVWGVRKNILKPQESCHETQAPKGLTLQEAN